MWGNSWLSPYANALNPRVCHTRETRNMLYFRQDLRLAPLLPLLTMCLALRKAVALEN